MSNDLDRCKSCETRRRAGFDGQCPSCAKERVRNEMAAERAVKLPKVCPWCESVIDHCVVVPCAAHSTPEFIAERQAAFRSTLPARPAAEIERLVDALLEAQENATAGIPTDEEDEHEAAKGEVATARTALLAALATPARADAANVREAEHFGAREGAEHLRAVAHQIERIAATLPPLATGGA